MSVSRPGKIDVWIVVFAPIIFFWGLLVFGGASAGLPVSQRLLFGLSFAALWAPVMYVRIRN